MNRRTLAVLGLAVLAAMAGCAGLLGTETPTPTNNSSSPAAYDLPLNGTAVLDGHVATLDSEGTFTYQQNATARLAGNQSAIINYNNVTARTNLSADLFSSEQSVAVQPHRSYYVGGSGTTFVRQRTSNGSEYTVYDDQEPNTEVYRRPALAGYIDGLEFTKAGTDTVDGVTVDRYTVTNTSQVDTAAHDPELFNASSLESISVTVAIDRDGVVRSFQYDAVGLNAEGERLSYHLSLRYSDIGSTTVAEPGWLDDARQSS